MQAAQAAMVKQVVKHHHVFNHGARWRSPNNLLKKNRTESLIDHSVEYKRQKLATSARKGVVSLTRFSGVGRSLPITKG